MSVFFIIMYSKGEVALGVFNSFPLNSRKRTCDETLCIWNNTKYYKYFFLIIHTAWCITWLIAFIVYFRMKWFSYFYIQGWYWNLPAEMFKQKVRRAFAKQNTEKSWLVWYESLFVSRVIVKPSKKVWIKAIIFLKINAESKEKMQQWTGFGMQNDIPFNFWTIFLSFIQIFFVSLWPHNFRSLGSLLLIPFLSSICFTDTKAQKRSSETINYLSESH